MVLPRSHDAFQASVFYTEKRDMAALVLTTVYIQIRADWTQSNWCEPMSVQSHKPYANIVILSASK